MVDFVQNSGLSCYEQLSQLRSRDIYHRDMEREDIIKVLFPSTTLDLVNEFSDLTASFYGILLNTSINTFKTNMIDEMSRSFFYELGQIKARNIVDSKDIEIESDTRGIIKVLISAIFNGSPDYVFNVQEYTPRTSKILITGKDRYYRIAKALGIEKLLTWPTLVPFVEGIQDELCIPSAVSADLSRLSHDGDCACLYRFEM